MSTATAPKIEETPTYAITNSCQCFICPDCLTVSYGDVYGETCEHCDSNETLNFTDYCTGICTIDRDNVQFELREWLEKNPAEYGYLIIGSNMTWRNLSGSKVVGLDNEKIDFIEELSVDTEWNQYWKIDSTEGGKLSCVLTHHDSPCGESYIIAPRIGCVDEDERFSDWDY